MHVAIVLLGASCSGSGPSEGTALADFSYPPSSASPRCDHKGGAAGATNGISSRDGLRYNVRAPANLDRTYAHPLLLVYAPAGHSAERSESLTRLTTDATRRGFIVAYVDSRPLSRQTILAFARIPGEIADSWCIDRERVYATGHSDGGTVSTALAVLKETRGTVSAIAPSAAGFSRKDLEALECPAPIPVMVMHGGRDTHFPGWGKEAGLWWAGCNACNVSTPPIQKDDGCVSFEGCAPDGRTDYCEGTGTHVDWPPLRKQIIDFLGAAALKPGR